MTIGNNSFVGNSVLICADSIQIGDDVLVSWGCTIIDNDLHSLTWAERALDVREWRQGRKSWDDVTIAPIKIHDKAWIGFNAIILKGVSIGEGAVVGCGSVVTKDVPAYTVAAGNPARVLREIVREC